MGNQASTLNNMIKSSVDPKVQELSKQIDALKKQRGALMARMRESQYRLNYKKAEREALAKLAEMEKQKGKPSQSRDALAKLRRLRHSIEFKISTESLSLVQEKSMVRKISEINAQIEEGIKLEKLERKRGLVSKDIEAYNTALNEVIKSITELDAKLDELYSGIRKALGIQRRRAKAAQQPGGAPKAQPKRQEINLEDIVIIKKKEAKPQEQRKAGN